MFGIKSSEKTAAVKVKSDKDSAKHTGRAAAKHSRFGIVDRLSVYIDERTSIAFIVRKFARKIFPDHWSFLLGEVALYSFVVVFISGVFLTLFFQASQAPVHYQGSYAPLRGVEMSAAMDSTLRISFDIRAGLLVRQIHHWAALTFVASIGLHMLRVFFTGAFRKPREINWVIGFLLFLLAMAEGFTGYSLPDDLLSGNGLRIIDGMLLGIPFIGTWLSYLLFGGEFPGTQIVGRLYTLHILLLPVILIALIALHLVLVIVHKHTQYPGAGKTEKNVVGYPVLPVYAAKAGGFFFIVFGLIVLTASLFTINPIWNYGPYDPSPVSAGTQPDWYIGFADGALRLVPSGWEIVLFGATISFNILIPMVVLLLFLFAVAIYPFFEAWLTGDRREHHILDRPRNAPTRTAIGAAGVVFYTVLWAAAGSDLIATHFQAGIETIIISLRILLILGPILAFILTKRLCLALQRKDRSIVLHGQESGRIIRLPGGNFVEIETEINEYDRWRLVSYDSPKPLPLLPRENGKVHLWDRIRAALSRWFFENRIAPVSQEELDHKSDKH